MGGMIAQTMAIAQPERVRSLTSIMSTTGKRTVGWQHPRLLPNLLAPRRRAARRYVEPASGSWRADRLPRLPDRPRSGSAPAPARPSTAASPPAACCARCWRSSPSPTAARGCAALRMPTLVVHGLADKMVHVSGGRATAARHPRRRAAAHRRHGPRPAARALRDLRRRHPPHGDAHATR